MKTTERLKLQLKRKLPAILCAVFVVLLFGLYYLGVYDVSFMKSYSERRNRNPVML